MLSSLHGLHQEPARDVGKELHDYCSFGREVFSALPWMLPVVALGLESHCVHWKAGTTRAPLAVAQTPPCQSAQCSSCLTQQDLVGWGKCSVTLLAATRQAAHEELWPRFVPCRTFNWLIAQPEPHWFPPANTNPIQMQKPSQQNLSHPQHRKQRGQGSPQQHEQHCRRGWYPRGTCETAQNPGRTSWKTDQIPSRMKRAH